MKKGIIIILCTVLLTSCSQKQDVSFKYPAIKSEEAIDTIHGVAIEDPYRNLEDLNDSLVLNWFHSQAKLSDSIMIPLKGENQLFKRMEAYENRKTEIIDDYSIAADGSYFYIKRQQDERVGSLYHKENKAAEEVFLFSPEEYAPGSIINYFKASPDVSKVLISIAKKGDSRSTVVILDRSSGQLLPDKVPNVKSTTGGIHWSSDSAGFYFLQLPHYDYSDPTYLLNSEARYYTLGQQGISIPVLSKKHGPDLEIKEEDFPIIWQLLSSSTNRDAISQSH